MVDGVEFTQLGEETPVRDIRPGKEQVQSVPDWKDKILRVNLRKQVSVSDSDWIKI